ncbi:MAG: 3-deoxy-manno-octulosonate cytidylyltransferase [Crocinitomicaceae bacterium]|jgi:3-deoxy-manno-octulosonate cytidylyltransferase (CMP-KDO synthetase)|nr:3-deoxy-manno-octulosonate cytidylyltransferase [Crocinitomicaceae bacterium]
MKVLGIIPARFDSSRFPGKPLLDLKGKTMIQRVYEGAQLSNRLSEVIVATDDQRIYDHVVAFGGKVMMTQKNHPSGTDRCGEVAAAHPDYEVVINIQGDEPLVSAEQLNQLISAFDDGADIATLGIQQVSEADFNNPNRIKLVRDHQGNALYFSRSPIPSVFHAKPEAKSNYPFMRHIGLYGYRSSTLAELVQLKPSLLEQVESLEQLRWLYYGYKIRVIETTIETPNIDTPEDIAAVLPFL